MSRLRIDSFAKIFRIAEEDNFFFKYRKQLIGLKIKIHSLYRFPRDGPWCIVTGILQEDLCLNSEGKLKKKKGEHLWFRRVNLKSISHI